MKLKLIESDEIKAVSNNNLHCRSIVFNMRPHLFTEMLIRHKYNQSWTPWSSHHYTFVLMSDNFLTPIDVFILGENQVGINIYPYDDEIELSKKTHRNYIKEKQACVAFIIKFAKTFKR